MSSEATSHGTINDPTGPFDSTKTFTGHIPSPDTPTGIKTAVMSWPTDAQWIYRQKAKKVVIQNLGRGQTKTDQKQADKESLVIYGECTEAGSATLTEEEANLLLDNLSATTPLRVDREGNQYLIDLAVPGATASFVFRIPTVRQFRNYDQARVKQISSRFGTQTFEVCLEPAADLFDAILISSNYPDSKIPIIHKAAAIDALIEDIKGTVEGAQSAPSDPSTANSPSSF